MNAVTQTETRAIETAAPLEVADPSKNLILVPLAVAAAPPKRNARKTPRLSIPELAASIARIGLLQNLVVILAADGEQYEVVAGDRRLTALKLLAKKKRIPCRLRSGVPAGARCFGPYRQPRGKPAARADAPGRPVRGVRRTGQGRPPHRRHCRRLRRDPAGGAAPSQTRQRLAAPAGRLPRRSRHPGTVDGPDHHRRPRRAGKRVLRCARMAAWRVRCANA